MTLKMPKCGKCGSYFGYVRKDGSFRCRRCGTVTEAKAS